MEEKKVLGSNVILIATLSIIALMYMFAFHSERNENKRLEKKIEYYKVKLNKTPD
jgi:hypothetical protein